MLKSSILLILFLSVFFSIVPATAETTFSLDVLAASVSPRDMNIINVESISSAEIRDIPFIPELIPMMTVKLTPGKKNVKPSAVFFEPSAGITISPLGIDTSVQEILHITRYFTLTAAGNADTCWNYGSMYTVAGVYDAANRKYMASPSFGSALLKTRIEAAAMLPVHRFIFRVFYAPGFQYNTAAENGEVWKFGFSSSNVNGWSYQYGGSVMYLFNSFISYAGIQFSASGLYSWTSFDSRFDDYDPLFVTYSVTPVMKMTLTQKQSLTFAFPIVRERKFSTSDYDSSETLFQTRTGTTWRLKALTCVYHLQLN